MWTLLSIRLVSHSQPTINNTGSITFLTGIDLHSAARMRGYEEYFRAIHSYLNKQLSGYYKLKEYNNLNLQFTCCSVSVDILLSPYFRSSGEYCNFLEIIDQAQLSL